MRSPVKATLGLYPRVPFAVPLWVVFGGFLLKVQGLGFRVTLELCRCR